GGRPTAAPERKGATAPLISHPCFVPQGQDPKGSGRWRLAEASGSCSSRVVGRCPAGVLQGGPLDGRGAQESVARATLSCPELGVLRRRGRSGSVPWVRGRRPSGGSTGSW